MEKFNLTLSYQGNETDNHEIDFYDVAQALEGFQRSLAITTHLVLNGEVITQAPSLVGARIIALPPEEGSWKFTAIVSIVAAGFYNIGTTPKDTPLGNLVSSAYDYVISETMGFHVDYEKTLGQQYEELNKKHNIELPLVTPNKLNSVAEKCEGNIIQMHRPIFYSKTAQSARLISNIGNTSNYFSHTLNMDTFSNIAFIDKGSVPFESIGRVAGYSVNTYKGRMFLENEDRTIPFIISEEVRDGITVSKITKSLTLNAKDRFDPEANITFTALHDLTRTGRLKSLRILDVA